MLTLRELRNMVKVAEVEGRVPSVKALLEAKVPIIVKELLSEQAEVSVYQNGFVLYRVGKRATVFPLHSCKEYMRSTGCWNGWRKKRVSIRHPICCGDISGI